MSELGGEGESLYGRMFDTAIQPEVIKMGWLHGPLVWNGDRYAPWLPLPDIDDPFEYGRLPYQERWRSAYGPVNGPMALHLPYVQDQKKRIKVAELLGSVGAMPQSIQQVLPGQAESERITAWVFPPNSSLEWHNDHWPLRRFCDPNNGQSLAFERFGTQPFVYGIRSKVSVRWRVPGRGQPLVGLQREYVRNEDGVLVPKQGTHMLVRER